MSPAALVLASQSSGRLATLRAAGVNPLVRISEVDEPAVLEALSQERTRSGRPQPTPTEQVQALARAKALDVAHRSTPLEDASATVVVGCDSMLEIDGQVVGKPRTNTAVRERWAALAGATGVLHSGHTVVRLGDSATEGATEGGTEGAIAEGVSSTVVHFGSPTAREVEAYVATGEPQWCAGAFTIDGYGGAFIEGVEGDPHGVVGLSLPLLRRLLAGLGVTWTDLWELPAGSADREATGA
ncbi:MULTISPECIES: Maf family protein [Actinomyces]|uniref:Nucleoside triphosphate pyrophosphatase n=1 Tax=Actinomyces respiraculi TaxID=2744574 RepID=A0A7T0LMD6_9ACTO|nr:MULTISPECIES: Maf family protein [Actinomyces]QPL05793.1 septum formation inhibitor Maf [Actinomyces respiraculi]